MLLGYDSMNDDDASLMLGMISMEVRKSTRVLAKKPILSRIIIRPAFKPNE